MVCHFPPSPPPPPPTTTIAAPQVRHHVPSFHEIIDRVVGVRHRTGSMHSAGTASIHRDRRGTAASLRPVDPTTAIPTAAAAPQADPSQPAAAAGDPAPPQLPLPPGLAGAGGWAAPGAWDAGARQQGAGGWSGQAFASASLEISAVPDPGRRVFALGAADPGRPTGFA